MNLLIRGLNFLGRALEFVLTGEADFAVTTTDGRPAEVLRTSAQARPLLPGVLEELEREFGLRLSDPIVLEVCKPPALGWRGSRLGREDYVGRYQADRYGAGRFHRVQVAPGLPRARFRAILAHELTHAWQRESGWPAGHALREGMARWIEYHFLLRAGRRAEAMRLLGLRYYLFGRAVREILEHERVRGRRNTLAWLQGG